MDDQVPHLELHLDAVHQKLQEAKTKAFKLARQAEIAQAQVEAWEEIATMAAQAANAELSEGANR